VTMTSCWRSTQTSAGAVHEWDTVVVDRDVSAVEVVAIQRRGTGSGIDDAFVDFDNSNGESSEFLKWMSPKGSPEPEPAPQPIPRPTQARSL